jgi:hypothetical protein
MTIICLEYKAVTVDYFLDKMQFYELDILLENLNYCVRSDWEMTRNIMWSNLAPMSKKRIKPKDVLELPFDTPKQVKLPKQEVTQATVEKAMALAQKRKEVLLKSGALN